MLINLQSAAARLVALIEQAREQQGRFLLILTGVPGSGKTLAGLPGSGIEHIEKVPTATESMRSRTSPAAQPTEIPYTVPPRVRL